MPETAASRARAVRPPRVPITAPIMPATPPNSSDLRAAPNAVPDRAPIAMRAPNWTGTVRLGVDGS